MLNALVEIGKVVGPSSSGKSRTSPKHEIEFYNFGLREYPECGTPWEVLAYHQLDGKSLAQRISGMEKIEEHEKIAEKYTEDAPQ